MKRASAYFVVMEMKFGLGCYLHEVLDVWLKNFTVFLANLRSDFCSLVKFVFNFFLFKVKLIRWGLSFSAKNVFRYVFSCTKYCNEHKAVSQHGVLGTEKRRLCFFKNIRFYRRFRFQIST